jgi:hypothetical protein
MPPSTATPLARVCSEDKTRWLKGWYHTAVLYQHWQQPRKYSDQVHYRYFCIPEGVTVAKELFYNGRQWVVLPEMLSMQHSRSYLKTTI